MTEASGRGHVGSREASWWLSTDLVSVRRARRLTRQTLAEWGFEDQVEVAELLVSELVGNALHHARGQVRLSFSAADGRLRCEVEDEDPELPHMRTAGLDAESGRGLFLVDMLSGRWGGVPTSRGKAIWFELPAFRHFPRVPAGTRGRTELRAAALWPTSRVAVSGHLTVPGWTSDGAAPMPVGSTDTNVIRSPQVMVPADGESGGKRPV